MMLASEIRQWMKDMPDDTDMGYVERKEAAMRSLKLKLKI